jgi:hypothetical protein
MASTQSHDAHPGGENARDPQRSGVSATRDPDRDVLHATDSRRDTFHRGMGCASHAAGEIETLTLREARERGLAACGNCAPDLASLDPRLSEGGATT